MAKQLTIKEIAERAGVSPGTVDRVLHNRGKVSVENLGKVQAILEEVGYKNNLHTSAVALSKTFHIAVAIPTYVHGDYWSRVADGFAQALEEYSDIDMQVEWFMYDQFDEKSCAEQFNAISGYEADAVIIGPTFEEDTVALCNALDERSIPYAFVDSCPAGTSPVNAFATDQPAGGYILGKILDGFMPAGSSMAILRTVREGSESHNYQERMNGLVSYLDLVGRPYLEFPLNMKDQGMNRDEVLGFLGLHPEVGCIAVMNSRGSLVADVLKAAGKSDIVVGGFDLTADNARCLADGTISVLLCQRPALQGFHALRSLLSFLLYKSKDENNLNTMPIDIVMKENLPFYRDSADL